MFPFRRHGTKKRGKGAPRNSRGPQRPLPNSARDLLPLLQPATKALAQMLAGRTGASGQLNHARNMLAHAERLIDDRMHNRLIPAEREEFFEQLARLRLTLADADAEAEVQAAEEQEEKPPPQAPVARERLKEMALALSRPDRERLGPRRPTDQPDDRAAGGPPVAEAAHAADTPGESDEDQQDRPALKPLADLPGRLVLSRDAGDQARRVMIAKPPVRRAVRSSTRAAGHRGGSVSDAIVSNDARQDVGKESDERPDEPAATGAATGGPAAGNGAAVGETTGDGSARGIRRGRKTKDGLPEGWVIDDEGYVVPRLG
jgi:hypothetical protein